MSSEVNNRKTAIGVTAFIIAILVIDQLSKIYVKTSFELCEHVDVFSWFQIFFIENRGMAFGMELGSKIILTSFRIVACVFLIYALVKLVKNTEMRRGFVYTVAAIFAGALGNVIDCVFYGKIFSDSHFTVAKFMPDFNGYGNWFEGRVVDMFYFPLIKDSSGEVLFFQAIFNVADIAVTCGVFVVILFYRHELNLAFESKKEREARLSKS